MPRHAVIEQESRAPPPGSLDRIAHERDAAVDFALITAMYKL
jgi:hypothetical protein